MPADEHNQRGRRLWADQSERRRLIQARAGLVERVVGAIAAPMPGRVDRENLMSAGILGLIRAVEVFDPTGGADFEQFAARAIRRAVLDELGALDWVTPDMEEKARRIEAVLHDLELESHRPPDESEIAEALGMTLEEYWDALSEVGGLALVSMSTRLSGGEAGGGAKAGLRESLAAAIGELPDDEQLLVALVYHEGLTFEEIAQLLEMPERRVCQMHTQALLRLRPKLDEPGSDITE